MRDKNNKLKQINKEDQFKKGGIKERKNINGKERNEIKKK